LFNGLPNIIRRLDKNWILYIYFYVNIYAYFNTILFV
jgi:hypothetical protein